MGLGAFMAMWYASSTNPGERDFRARFVEVNQDVMSVSDQVQFRGLYQVAKYILSDVQRIGSQHVHT